MHASSDRYGLLREFQKQNRQFPTEAERLFWEYYRHNISAYKLRRQYIIDDFIVDFVCLSIRLVIEIDGEYHFEEEQRIDDQQRAARLEQLGFSVIRFTNEQVIHDIENVFSTIGEIVNGKRIATGSNKSTESN